MRLIFSLIAAFLISTTYAQQTETVDFERIYALLDFNFAEGTVSGDSLYLSTFDGAHAFLFEAKVTDSTLAGTFYSGNHWKEPLFPRDCLWNFP